MLKNASLRDCEILGGLFGAAAGLFVAAIFRSAFPPVVWFLLLLAGIAAGVWYARTNCGKGGSEASDKPATAASAETTAKPAAKPAPKPEPAKVPAAAEPVAKPALLSAARAGGADDLKRISGVGPKLEQRLNDMGVYHYDQIAGWTDREIAWVDDQLKFKGRIVRDKWIEQAGKLARGEGA